MDMERVSISELISRATWREAVTYRDTWPHEYVLTERDAQQERGLGTSWLPKGLGIPRPLLPRRRER